MKNEIPAQAERILELGQEDLKRVLDSITESIYGVDLNGNCTFCNTSFLKTLGYKSVEEILGRNIHQLIHHHHADGTPYTIESCLIYTALKNAEGAHTDQEVFWRADGTSFPIE